MSDNNILSDNNITIIMLTAKGQELDEKKGRAAGAPYYITKPFSPRRILRLVEECTQPSGGGRA